MGEANPDKVVRELTIRWENGQCTGVHFGHGFDVDPLAVCGALVSIGLNTVLQSQKTKDMGIQKFKSDILEINRKNLEASAKLAEKVADLEELEERLDNRLINLEELCQKLQNP